MTTTHRILHIASGDFFSTYGGGQVYVKNIVDEMLRQDMDVAVISTVGDEDRTETKSYNGAKLTEIGNATVGLRLKEIISGLSPDVIHAHSRKAEICAIGQELNIPVVVTAHHGGILCPAGTRMRTDDTICHCTLSHKNCLPCTLRQIPGGMRFFYPAVKHLSEDRYLKIGEIISKRRFIPFVTPIGCAARNISNKTQEWKTVVENCTLMIAPCQEIADAMTINGLDKEKLRIIPHGIPLPDHRTQYPPIAGKIKFFCVGRICYIKGIHILLEAFQHIEAPNIELHIIGGAGNKREEKYMSRIRQRFKSDKRIIWHGKIAPDNVFETIKPFHISVSATVSPEAFGLNIAESLAMGKPALATRSGGSEQQITDGFNGWLVPTNNPIALANKIKEIISAPEKLAEMSANCNAISIKNHIKTLTEVYKYAKHLKTSVL